MKRLKIDILWITLITVLAILCFPANPLVLTGVLDTYFHPALFIIGWVVWAFGFALVLAPIIMFPRWGGVPKGKTFVHTTQLVDTGIYSVVRHPQYTGGVYSIFVTTLLWYPHWLFAVLGFIGTVATYFSIKEEDKLLVKKYGEDYVKYMQRVPGMNIFLGIIRANRRKSARQHEERIYADAENKK
ncbi:MAG: isoprenylcysteine carboxylmethyltransferase family protein [Dehalococcoidales bacterium]|nr:isoprenylcysteine carboxylmethyltransferase family protein [Dehalococcoidales bacterium]